MYELSIFYLFRIVFVIGSIKSNWVLQRILPYPWSSDRGRDCDPPKTSALYVTERVGIYTAENWPFSGSNLAMLRWLKPHVLLFKDELQPKEYDAGSPLLKLVLEPTFESYKIRRRKPPAEISSGTDF